MRFYPGPREWAPNYGDIDWNKLPLDCAGEDSTDADGSDDATIWFDSEDGLVMECTQANTVLYISETHDDSDTICVGDHRDGQPYFFHRSLIGNDEFDRVSHSLQRAAAAAIVMTHYPMRFIFEAWLAYEDSELAEQLIAVSGGEESGEG